jgi:predicted nucleotide-binding protein
MAKKQNGATPSASPKRSYLKQSDVPMTTLDDALRVPQAILDHYAGKPSSPLHVAKALSIDPGGSQFKLITGAAIAFGLIDGGAQAAAIGVTDLARRILRPKAEHEDLVAKREAVLLPRVFGLFLKQYDRHPFPRTDIAQNVLEEMGVPRDKTTEVLDRIDSSARSVGFIEEIKDKLYVTVQGTATQTPVATTETEDVAQKIQPPPRAETRPPAEPSTQPKGVPVTKTVTPRGSDLTAAIADDLRRRRVFITHGKNKALVDPISKLLEYGELEPVVSVDRQSVSKPVPEKVMDDMRGCGAAIIHVDAEQTIVAKDGTEHVVLNPNVLIEIGAAMAFYGRRFILLVREGVKLPSNLQGLYEVRYSGDTLDAVATIKLLEAIKDIKNYALPTMNEAVED